MATTTQHDDSPSQLPAQMTEPTPHPSSLAPQPMIPTSLPPLRGKPLVRNTSCISPNDIRDINYGQLSPITPPARAIPFNAYEPKLLAAATREDTGPIASSSSAFQSQVAEFNRRHTLQSESPHALSTLSSAAAAASSTAAPYSWRKPLTASTYSTLVSGDSWKDQKSPMGVAKGRIEKPSTFRKSQDLVLVSRALRTEANEQHGLSVEQGPVHTQNGLKKKEHELRKEELKREQNRVSARRFRLAQKARVQAMKDDLVRKSEEIRFLKEKVLQLEQYATEGGRSNERCCVDQRTNEAVMSLYSQLLSVNLATLENPTGGESYATLLGMHLRTVLVDAVSGAVLKIMKQGSHVTTLRDGSELVKALSPNVLLWNDVQEPIQVEDIKTAVTANKPMAIAYQRRTQSTVYTVNAALAPVPGSSSIVVAEFIHADYFKQ